MLQGTTRHWGHATRARQYHPQWNKNACMPFRLRAMDSFHTAKRHSKWWLGLWSHPHPSCTWCFAARSHCSVAFCQTAGTTPTSICLQREAELGWSRRPHHPWGVVFPSSCTVRVGNLHQLPRVIHSVHPTTHARKRLQRGNELFMKSYPAMDLLTPAGARPAGGAPRMSQVSQH